MHPSAPSVVRQPHMSPLHPLLVEQLSQRTLRPSAADEDTSAGCAQTRLLNGAATCNMAMGRWEEAESQLQEAFEKDAKSADTLANLVTVSLHQGKPASRYIKCVSCQGRLVRVEQGRLMMAKTWPWSSWSVLSCRSVAMPKCPPAHQCRHLCSLQSAEDGGAGPHRGQVGSSIRGCIRKRCQCLCRGSLAVKDVCSRNACGRIETIKHTPRGAPVCFVRSTGITLIIRTASCVIHCMTQRQMNCNEPLTCSQHEATRHCTVRHGCMAIVLLCIAYRNF